MCMCVFVWVCRMACRLSVLARSLLRFLVDVSAEPLSPELTEELSNRASRCLLLLDHCSHGALRVRTGRRG